MYLKIPPKIGKKVDIHFYENILSEINLPLKSKRLRIGFFSKSFLMSFIFILIPNFKYQSKILISSNARIRIYLAHFIVAINIFSH